LSGHRGPGAGLRDAAQLQPIAEHDFKDVRVIDDFASLDGLKLGDHGDARERNLWPTVAKPLSNYETFWRTLIVLLTNRIEPTIKADDPEWIRLRPAIPCAYERLTMHNYSLFYCMARARQAIEEDRRHLTSGSYPHPEIAFFRLQAAVEHAQELQRIARDEILCDLGIGLRVKPGPGPIYPTICKYRNAFTHDPVLGRAIDQGRELLPPENRLPEGRKNYLLWRDIANIPANEMVDGLCLQEQLWQHLSAFLQRLWRSLTEAFLQARQCDKFLAALGLSPLLPIRCTPVILSHAATAAPSGTVQATSSTDTVVHSPGFFSPKSRP
jgi:hypothetical protein